MSAAGILVSPGDIFAIVLISADELGYSWTTATFGGPDYLPGGAYFRSDTFATWTAGTDRGFKTYVEAAGPIPEPGTLLLTALGLGILARRRRRRNV